MAKMCRFGQKSSLAKTPKTGFRPGPSAAVTSPPRTRRPSFCKLARARKNPMLFSSLRFITTENQHPRKAIFAICGLVPRKRVEFQLTTFWQSKCNKKCLLFLVSPSLEKLDAQKKFLTKKVFWVPNFFPPTCPQNFQNIFFPQSQISHHFSSLELRRFSA